MRTTTFVANCTYILHTLKSRQIEKDHDIALYLL